MSDSLRPHEPQHTRPPCPSSNSWSLPKLMPVESVMPSNHLILCCPFLLLPSIFPNIRAFSNELALRIRWQKYWRFSFNISPSVTSVTSVTDFVTHSFIHSFLSVPALCCCVLAFSSCCEFRLLFAAVHRLLIAEASLAADQGSRASELSCCGRQTLEHQLSSCEHGLSCFVGCGIFPDQGLNPCPLHWQADS